MNGLSHVLPVLRSCRSAVVSRVVPVVPLTLHHRLISGRASGAAKHFVSFRFAKPKDFPVNVAGRIGFLDHVQRGLVDYEQLLYLSPYTR
ncbi:MAG: hypothetical protein HOP19_17855 [Acidobacteria bacterium]|nr:hypothetical protein [Acidobacteriota bacterium]